MILDAVRWTKEPRILPVAATSNTRLGRSHPRAPSSMRGMLHLASTCAVGGTAAGVLRRRSVAARGVATEALPKREQHLVLVDGNAILHQSYYAMAHSNLTNPAGDPTGAVFGFLKHLRVVQRVWNPSHFAVLMDHEVNHRKELFSQYKENRAPCPEDLVCQFSKAREACEAFKYAHEDRRGFEADDLIATHTRKASEADHKVVIISSDKDLLQLVGPKVEMCRTSNLVPRPATIDQKWVKKNWGVEPAQMLDLLSLVGDVSDGIPGVPGIGRIKAAALLNRYGSLDGVLEAARGRKPLDVPGVGVKLTANIRSCEQQVLKMKKLIELQQVPGVKDFQDLEVVSKDEEWLQGAESFCIREDMKWLKDQVRKDFENEAKAGEAS